MSKASYLLGPYTDPRERAVGLFFKGLTEHVSRAQTRARLASLLQHNIAIVNLWSEYRYKGYHYLTKAKRRQLYANLQLIADDFDRFCMEYVVTQEAAVERIHMVAPQAVVDPVRALRLQALMAYFSPDRGIYEYRESSSFGRLLRNPTHEKLIGDCNQIVTLYIYLYARYHDVRDLQIRTLPGHVALHYGGVDIETTNGTYVLYDKAQGSKLLPIEEIVSINLLDTTDSYLSTHEVAAEDFLQASRFAFILSHDRDIVTKNLAAAYNKIVSTLIEHNNYKRALEFAGTSGNKELLGLVGHNGALYEIEHRNYAAARRFASVAADRDELIRTSWHTEGIHRYQTRRYHEAIRAFEHVGDQARIHQCYEALFFEQQSTLGSNLTSDSLKQYAKIIKRMYTYAKKSGNKELVDYSKTLMKHL